MDARIGLCVHGSVPQMHSRTLLCSANALAVVRSHVATVGASGRSHRSSCDIKAHKRHSSCSQGGFTIQVKLWCSCL